MLNPVQKIEFLGLEIDSVAMKLSLPQRKVEEIVQMSQNALNNKITLRELTQLIGKLTSTVQAILPAKLQIRFLQQIQIKALRKSLAYESLITLDLQAKDELSWWMTNMKMYNGMPLSIVPPDTKIFLDASKQVGGTFQGISTGGAMVSYRENVAHKCS